ncbi:MAG: MgtC/SapB family protein [Gemmatimonadetes bacterium]|nr:MgtC/SapB family protein [Gemmatimonadota bacterium]NNM34149.1 MgtC/SapB family protein [Gemmatimonadota bacterium]
MPQLPIEPESVVPAILSLLVAFALSLPIAWNREQGRRRMGLRTFPLVAMASCAYVLIGLAITGESSESLARIVQGLITGIGFIGGGAILKSSEEVKGASTAAAIWATGALGAAVALDRYELAIAIAVMTFLVFLVLTPVREKMDNGD